MGKQIRGINILNPVDIDREYYLKAIDFAIKNNYNHIQLNGPIHDFKKCNIDGMTRYKKYSNFNYEKNEEYIDYCLKVVNVGLEKSHKNGIKTYMWHHELDVPTDFSKIYPEILNDLGDVEITHPIIKDFLNNKFDDFFNSYPLMDGIVITFYETKIPLLRLKNQKLNKDERMEYVTKILYDACKRNGKELIVRTDATLEEDYIVLLDTYEKVSKEMVVMDKWTQFDWSLTLPSNQFIKNINKSPLLIETDLFGEFFGKGRLPLMLKEHIKEKFEFCEQFNPIGYCSRIDRGGYHCFGSVNEVNLHIMKAVLEGRDVDETINDFFFDNYKENGCIVKSIMEKTEEVVRKTLFANGYYFSELSLFPTLNHCKNHFYFELMKDNCEISSDEWFIPKNYERGKIENIFSDLEDAKLTTEELLKTILTLENKIEEKKYKELFVKFKNLELVAKCWLAMAKVFFHYVKYFESKEDKHKTELYRAFDLLRSLNKEGKMTLKEQFYCCFGEMFGETGKKLDNIENFVIDAEKSFLSELNTTEKILQRNPIDFVVCGGGNESHKLQKEVNFSDTLFIDGELVRIPGNKSGEDWSYITAHGWFSYELKTRKNYLNKVIITVCSSNLEKLSMKVTIDEKEFNILKDSGKKQIVEIPYQSENKDSIRIKIEKIAKEVPCVYSIEII